MTYNLSGLGYGTDTFLDLTTSINSFSAGLLGTVILFAIFFIFWKNDINGWITSSFITTVIGIIMLFLGLVTWAVLVIPIFALISSLLIYFYN